MTSPDISVLSMVQCFLLLAIPLTISYLIKLHIIRVTTDSVARMTVQLLMVGVFLTFVFDLNNGFLNLAWVLGMVTIATYTTIRNVELKMGRLLAPMLLSFAAANLSVLLYFNEFVLDLENLLEARYLIPIGGMILGNSLRGNVVGIGDFYEDIKRNENRYLYNLSLGASKYEALLPYIRKCLRSALRPTLANIATAGLVFLPGMMTGQILGGASPILAIKYQISIMIALYVSTAMSTTFSILSTIRTTFDEYGLVRKEIYREKKGKGKKESRHHCH
ncbi:ABC transporter permease [Methanosarcina sp. KYL-1]|uniref:ABC transporter permease n=1 Tax=Methanosarcina sp. KYL-1 TaxID=2602068 RepID=UPI002100FA7E|nr:ABC transporter permease [Methanosarcina sp. KYL-1]MCQ1535463.1 ABC transporter permease [Methanosarcina sp. KYL-1]